MKREDLIKGILKALFGDRLVDVDPKIIVKVAKLAAEKMGE